MAPVVRRLAREPDFELSICVTGQHREMLDQVLSLFSIRPDFDLDIMRPEQDLTDITSRALCALRPVFAEVDPDVVLVHGDTTTTLVGSLAGYFHRTPVAHVEAGLRTGDMYSPWPEEGNRRIAGTLSAFHFAPTESARDALISEGVPSDRIRVTGNSVVDALLLAKALIDDSPSLQAGLKRQFSMLDDQKKLLLVTGHRRESFGPGFERICRALRIVAKTHEDTEIVYPVHMNPNVRRPVERILEHSPNVHLLEPLDYLPFVYLMDRSHLILTDSGGIQEEAPSLGRPVLVMRDTTERPEAIVAGTAVLVGTDEERIVGTVARLMRGDGYQEMACARNPYGTGNASELIVQGLRDFKSVIQRLRSSSRSAPDPAKV
jgi:UDP-N-acetylglucosamine 2-epimerase (non-hydrolysing)